MLKINYMLEYFYMYILINYSLALRSLYSDLISKDEQEQLKDGYYLRYIRNQYSLAGRPKPFNLTVTIKISQKNIPDLIENILNCFRFPLTIGIDF